MFHDVSFFWFRLFRHGEPGWVVSRLGIAPSRATAPRKLQPFCNLVPLWLSLQQIATANNFHLSWNWLLFEFFKSKAQMERMNRLNHVNQYINTRSSISILADNQSLPLHSTSGDAITLWKPTCWTSCPLSMRGKLCKFIGNFMYHVISASVRKFGTDPDQETKTKATQAISGPCTLSHLSRLSCHCDDFDQNQNWVLRLAVLLPIETRNCWQLLGWTANCHELNCQE